MNSTDRLVRRIGAVLNDDARGFEARALAADYAALVDSVRDRLTQCVALIRANNEHTALQIAESHPPVLDLAAKLAFAESVRWRQWCRAAGLPCPAPIDDHLIEQVNALYEKTIDQTHPLYREYRAAVRERDDLRALTVLRSITRVNAGDANARDEYERLVAKVRRELLARISEAFRHHRHDEAFALMSTLENAVPGPFEENADWRDASRARSEWEARKMKGEALMTLPELLKLKAAGEWQPCIALLAKARALRQQYGFSLSPEDEQQFAHLETWVLGHSAVVEKVRQERAELEKLNEGLESILAAHTAPPTGSAEARKRLAQLDAWLAETRAAPQTVHVEPAIARATAHRDALVATLASFSRKRGRRIAIGAVLTLSLAAGGAYLAGEAARTREFGNALAAAESAAESAPVSAFLAGPARAHPDMTGRDDYRPRVEALRAKALAWENTRATLAENLRGLLAALGKADGDHRAHTAALARLRTEFESLPADLRRELNPDLERATAACGLRAGAAAESANAALADATRAVEALLAGAESPDVAAQWRPACDKLTAALNAPDVTDDTAIAAARATLANGLRVFPERDTRLALALALADARSLDAHLAALRAATARDTRTPAALAAARITAAERTLRALPVSVLPRATAAMLPHAIVDTRFIHEKPSALEASDAARITAEASRFQDLWRLTMTRMTADGATTTSLVIFSGRPDIVTYALSGGEETRTKGARLKADGTTTEVTYAYRKFEGRAGAGDLPGVPAKAPESELLALSTRLFDSDRGVFTESPLVFADRIYAARAASPLLRARLLLLLQPMLETRAEARGLAFCPELRADLETLAKLATAAPRENAWLTPERYGDLLPGLAKYFDARRPAYAALADFRVRLVRGVVDAGVRYVGACDASGRPVIRGVAAGTRLIALNAEGAPVALAPDGVGAPYSPVFVLEKSPAEAAAALNTKVSPEAPGGDWTNLFLPAP